MVKKFSDNMLSQLYLGLAADYKALSKKSPALTPEQIYWTLYFKVYGELANSNSAFHELDYEGQGKTWAVFNAFIASTPLYKNNFAQLQQFRREQAIKDKLKKKQSVIFIIDSEPYCRHNVFLIGPCSTSISAVFMRTIITVAGGALIIMGIAAVTASMARVLPS